jgi:hypothetical protein
MYRRRDAYAQSDHDFINAVRGCLGLAPIPVRGPQRILVQDTGEKAIDRRAALPVMDGNRRTPIRGSDYSSRR